MARKLCGVLGERLAERVGSASHARDVCAIKTNAEHNLFSASFVWRCLSGVRPWLRFHIPLIEPDMQISRIRLSDKTSPLRFRVRRHLQLSNTSRS